MKDRQFTIGFISLFTITSLIAVFLKNLEGNTMIHPYFWFIQMFFFVVMAVTHILSKKGLEKLTDFHIFYMASMGIRFLLSLIFIFVTVLLSEGYHMSLVLNFFILYLIYTSFEIYFLLINLRLDFKNDGKVIR